MREVALVRDMLHGKLAHTPTHEYTQRLSTQGILSLLLPLAYSRSGAGKTSHLHDCARRYMRFEKTYLSSLTDLTSYSVYREYEG